MAPYPRSLTCLFLILALFPQLTSGAECSPLTTSIENWQTAGDFQLNSDLLKVRIQDRHAQLTPATYIIFELLIHRTHQVVSHNEIFTELERSGLRVSRRNLTQLILTLKQQLSEGLGREIYNRITAIRQQGTAVNSSSLGYGYAVEAPPADVPIYSITHIGLELSAQVLLARYNGQTISLNERQFLILETLIDLHSSGERFISFQELADGTGYRSRRYAANGWDYLVLRLRRELGYDLNTWAQTAGDGLLILKDNQFP